MRWTSALDGIEISEAAICVLTRRAQLLLGGDGSPVAAYFATDTGPSGVADSEFWNMVVPLRPP